MKYLKISLLGLVFVVVLAILPGTVYGLTDPYDGCPSGQLNTALGCIPVKPAVGLGFDHIIFIRWVIRNIIYIASGVAFLLMIFGGFKILTSGGSAENIKAGTELISAALSGLLFVIFSVVILRLIGTDILRIPEF